MRLESEEQEDVSKIKSFASGSEELEELSDFKYLGSFASLGGGLEAEQKPRPGEERELWWGWLAACGGTEEQLMFDVIVGMLERIVVPTETMN